MTLIAIVDFHDCGKITAVDFEAIGTFIELKHHVWKHLLPHASQSDIQIWRLHDALSIDEAPIVLEKNHLLKIASKMDSMTARVASEIYVVAQSPPAIYFLAADGTHPSQDIEGSEDSISEMSSRFSKLLSDARLSKPLSKLAKSSDYRVWQKGESPVYDGRFSSHTPTHTVGPPVELFYEGFAEFIENIQPRSSLQLPSEFARDVSKFMSKVSGIYENEAAFKSVILPPLEKVLGRKLVTLSNSDRTTPDLAFLSRLQRILGLAELKRDIGEGGCDASTQASLSVLRYWAQAENEPAIKASCCPTYVFALSGPWLVILGAVITSRCIVQRLTDYLSGLGHVIAYSMTSMSPVSPVSYWL
ncbi:Proteinkinasesubdomain-containingproteinPKL ccin9 [Mycena sanguinolenta]|uniref:Proteinkinasesubdomain-containingproteinPKL ccin9 n=1 Tax=Mycena sanguinolenta TaxID=230812 RepID=A0A8H7CRZ9_9AGAR|nr:Proteinkinasesubdomain-containingproteinPKL ccin9 [Mycena sanguinolenta]